ncbi:MAG: TonB-dependent receptor plug domain-containing protein [Flavobacteriaceae bacterium]|nr:TonB-dependent receptor plug domain-containing protein [Flavobacteriaceae bacterium]
MLKRINQNALVFIAFSLISFSLFSQQKSKKIALVHIFKDIATQHQIQFNYDAEKVKKIFLIPPKKKLTLDSKIKYLKKNTNFSFQILDNNVVLVIALKQPFNFTICGYLKNEIDFSPLFSATIQSKDNFTISDENGYFKLKLSSKNDKIVIRYLGYKKITLTYSQFLKTDCKTIYLQLKTQILNEITLTNYLTKGIQKIENGNFEIDFSKFDILPGQIENDVLKTVQAFPGIQSVDETISNINIRGGSHDQNLILWNTIKMYQSGHFFGLISMFNPQITQKTTLLKNGSDSSFTDGVSGTIAMHSDKSINTTLKASISMSLIDANAFIDTPISKKSSLQIAARKSISEFLETPTYNAFFDRVSQDTEVTTNESTIFNDDKKFNFYDASLRWNYKINTTDNIQISFITTANELKFTENSVVNEIERSQESNITQNSIAGSLQYNKKWSKNFNTKLEIYETDYKLKAINANLLESQRFLQENIVSETSFKLKTNYILNSKITILNGYHFVETKIINLDDVDLPFFRSLVSEVIRSHSIFSSLNYQSEKTYLNFGVRYNFIEKFNKNIIEPRLSFSQKISKNLTFELLGEFKHQSTSQIINFQNDFLGIEKRRWQLANDKDIPIITSKQISSGLLFTKKNWLLNLEIYHKNINGITTQSQGFQNQYEFVKTNGSYNVTGLDFLLKKTFNNLNTWFSYSYMNNLYTFNALESNSFPSNFDITHAITFGTTYTNKKLKVSTGLNWHSGKPITRPINNLPIINNQINFDATNYVRLKDYLRVDVSAIYKFKLGNKTTGKIGFSILNILNKKNEVNSFYRINNAVVNNTLQHSLGIIPNVIFKIDL